MLSGMMGVAALGNQPALTSTARNNIGYSLSARYGMSQLGSLNYTPTEKEKMQMDVDSWLKDWNFE